MDIEDTERDIHGLRRQLTSAKTKDRTQDQRLATLETENAELKLYLAALLRLLRQNPWRFPRKLGTLQGRRAPSPTTNSAPLLATPQAWVHAIDAEDGQVDGTA